MHVLKQQMFPLNVRVFICVDPPKNSAYINTLLLEMLSVALNQFSVAAKPLHAKKARGANK